MWYLVNDINGYIIYLSVKINTNISNYNLINK